MDFRMVLKLVHVEHPATNRLFADRILSLPLGPDKEHVVPVGREIADKLRCLVEVVQGLLEVDNVNAVALAEDERLHLRIPAPSLMPEVDTRFEQFLHLNRSHELVLPYRFENWKRLRALG